MKHLRPRHSRSQRGPSRRTLGLSVALALGLASLGGPAAVATPGAPAQAPAAASSSYKVHIERADTSLARAGKQLRSHRYTQAVDSLTSARRHVKKANAGAKALIGAPPQDPESDDAPGPPAVLAVMKLDYRVSTGAVALLDGQAGASVVQALSRTVFAAQTRRDRVLDPVIALPAEGDGADYADGMADTLGQYRREVQSISGALQAFTLTTAAHDSLTSALARAKATQAKMEKAYGGGER